MCVANWTPLPNDKQEIKQKGMQKLSHYKSYGMTVQLTEWVSYKFITSSIYVT